jgi:predicted component of type VI protein secretion system
MMKAELVPENGDPPIPIVRDVTIVGRREYCDVRIDQPSLSKRHCILVKTDGLLVIRDLATTNGTKVKGQKVRWAALLPDDRISLGAYKMRVYLGPDDMPSPSEQYEARVRARGPGGWVGKAEAARIEPSAPPAITRWPEPASSPPYRDAIGPGFPEPSSSQIAARPDSNSAFPVRAVRKDARSPAPQAEFQFEILEDDREIIDLD